MCRADDPPNQIASFQDSCGTSRHTRSVYRHIEGDGSILERYRLVPTIGLLTEPFYLVAPSNFTTPFPGGIESRHGSALCFSGYSEPGPRYVNSENTKG